MSAACLEQEYSYMYVTAKPLWFLRMMVVAKAYWKSTMGSTLFGGGGPLQTGSNASWPTKHFKSQILSWRDLGIQTSCIPLNMVNHSTASYFKIFRGISQVPWYSSLHNQRARHKMGPQASSWTCNWSGIQVPLCVLNRMSFYLSSKKRDQ